MNNVIEGYSLSPFQKRQWLFEQNGRSLSNLIRLELKGHIVPGLLKSAFIRVAQRHEILRTAIKQIPGMLFPMQVIHPSCEPGWRFDDKMPESGSDWEEKVSAAMDELIKRTRDGEMTGPVNITLLQLSEDTYTLLLGAPVLCTDAISLLQIAREILCCYNAGGNTGDDPVFQFRQYAEWHNEVLQEAAAEETEFWERQLHTERTNIALPFQVSHYPDKIPHYRFVELGLDPSATAMIRSYAAANGLSVKTVLLGTWYMLVTGFLKPGEEMVMGCMFDGRTFDAFSNITGPLAKMLPLRLKPAEDERCTAVNIFRKLSRQLEEMSTWQDSFAWQDMTAELSFSERHYFPVAFEHIEANGPDMTGEISGEIKDIVSFADMFHLKLSCLEKSENISLKFIYAEALFEAAGPDHIKNAFHTNLEKVLADPAITEEQLPAAVGREKDLVLNRFNDTARPVPTGMSVKAAFEAHAAARPEDIAVVADNGSLTYKALNEQANKLAHQLIDTYRVQPDQIVALKVSRSLEMVVGLLGIVKSGAAFLPLDVNLPHGRTAYILQDSEARVLITDSLIDTEVPVIHLEAGSGLPEGNAVNPVVNLTPSNPVYAIYTSGSTGQPKGVLISNGSLLNYIHWFSTTYGTGRYDRTLLFSSIAFDLSYTSLWPSLLTGGTLFLLREAIVPEPDELIEKLINHQITYIKLTPSHFRLLVNDRGFDEHIKAYALKLIVLGGEEIIPADLLKFLRQRPDITFVNHYGPTETTIGTATCEISRDMLATFHDRPVIGAPVFNNRIYILGKDGALLPPGRTGEIAVGGAGVALGYLNREALTRERFIQSPFREDERLYLTGDLGRWDYHGRVEFLGRRDSQVKVRGYRIELNEIARALAGYNGIDAAAAGIREIAGEKQLVAYFTAKDKPAAGVLRAHLADLLPAYMLPACFVRIEQLPLTPNGKLDRKALAAFNINEPEGDDTYVAPLNAVEQKIAEIWSDVLGKQKIGVKDNFFLAGGHSLKAVQLISRIHEAFGVKILLRELFESPVIASLAEKVTASGNAGFEPVMPVPQADHYELSHAQKRLWILAQVEKEQTAYNMSVGYMFEGDLDRAAFEKVFATLIERHESLRTRFADINGEPRQVICDAAATAFAVRYTDLRPEPEPEEKISAIIKEETTWVFDLREGSLLRARLLQTAEQRYVFLFTLHHIIADAWSLEVLLREFLVLYNAYATGAPNPLSPLKIQYKEYAAWHNKQLQGADMERHKRFWLDQFSGKIPVLDFPADYPRPATKSYRGDTVSFRLDKEQAKGLHTLSRRHEATLFMTLLACVNALLYRYTGQEDIVIGSPDAGRDHKDLEDQIGLFLNNLSIRTRFRGSDAFSELLAVVREQCIHAYEHHAYPFDLLIGDLRIKRDVSRSPLFDIVVVLQNARFDNGTEEGMEHMVAGRFDSGFRTSTIDIRIVFTEEAEIIHCLIDYNTDIYKKDTLTGFFDHLSIVINEVIANDSIKIHDLCHGQLKTHNTPPELSTAFNF